MSMHATCILQIASQGSFHSLGLLRGLFIHKGLMLLTIYFSTYTHTQKKKMALINKFQSFFFQSKLFGLLTLATIQLVFEKSSRGFQHFP